MKDKFTLGIDFGTLGARAVIARVSDGTICGESVYTYPHGVITENLPEGFALQDPNDYINALKITVSQVICESGVNPSDILGVGVDFTSCTILPVDEDFTPLCFKDEFRNEPYAYAKLWKHHSTIKEADVINCYARDNKDEWIKYFGGQMTAEMGLPKILETYNKAPKVYESAYRFVEAGDYISYLLTGRRVSSACFSDFKYAHGKNGYPNGEFYKVFTEKLSNDVTYISGTAGEVNERGSELTGLATGTKVAVSLIDCHASLPALNVTKAGDLMIVLGTSACHIALGETLREVKGICGCTVDTVIPGLATYEAGQTAMGDVFDWFVKNNVPDWCREEAERAGLNIHEYLSVKASEKRVGESGLVGIDWLSGNRSILSDSSRKGIMTGVTLSTKPWDIYRAWLESCAFGTRVIVENYEANGIEIKEIKATGGIAVKNSFFMQILTDIIGKTIKVADVAQSAALGSSIYGATAAGVYRDVTGAAEHMSCKDYITYEPDPENVRIYNGIYRRYKKLHDFFGDRNND